MAELTVWVLYTETDFEGQGFMGVYANEEAAQAAAEGDHRSPLVWKRYDDGTLSAASVRWSSISYEVVKAEVCG